MTKGRGEGPMTVSKKPVALGTGSSMSIGMGIAFRLARECFALVINGVTADPSVQNRGAYHVKNLINDEGGIAEVFRADVSSSADREAIVSFVEKEFGRWIFLNRASSGFSMRSLSISRALIFSLSR